jgi:hypothetical protein
LGEGLELFSIGLCGEGEFAAFQGGGIEGLDIGVESLNFTVEQFAGRVDEVFKFGF